MIREDEIREFQEIIGGRTDDSENISMHSIFDRSERLSEEVEDDAQVEQKAKTDNPSTVILFITGILGLTFVVTVFIGAVMYIYLKPGSDDSNSNKSKPAQSLKIPGIESLVTDPVSDDSGKRIKVWCVRTAIPPPPQIGDYYSLFPGSDSDYIIQ
jgi:hypothetical protein